MSFTKQLFEMTSMALPEVTARKFSRYLGKSEGYYGSVSSQNLDISTNSLLFLSEILEHKNSINPNKKITELQGQPKEYTGTFFIGATTPSYDLETEIDQTFPSSHIDEALIHETVKQFLGEIDQKPPIFSAIKKDGVRLYEHARAGEIIEIASRKTTIHEFEITRIALPEIDFRVVCSKGTYIRSIVRDLGELLQSGAYLKKLVRTKIGEYDVKNAQSVESFNKEIYASLS